MVAPLCGLVGASSNLTFGWRCRGSLGRNKVDGMMKEESIPLEPPPRVAVEIETARERKRREFYQGDPVELPTIGVVLHKKFSVAKLQSQSVYQHSTCCLK